MKPIVHELENVYGDDIDFVYLDIDDPNTSEAQRKFNFRYQPHFILVDENGAIIEQWLGYNSANVFEDAFAQLLN